MSETTRGVLALIGFALYAAAALSAWRGWLTSSPDSSRRFRWRLRAWIAVGVGYYVMWLGDDNRRWWDWLISLGIFVLVMDRCSHWWRETERARQIERKFGVTS